MAKSLEANRDGFLYSSRWQSLRCGTEQFIHCEGEKGRVEVQTQNKEGGILMVDCYLKYRGKHQKTLL